MADTYEDQIADLRSSLMTVRMGGANELAL